MAAALTTSAELPNSEGLTKRNADSADVSGPSSAQKARGRSRSRKRGPPPKYRHVAAVHAETRTSYLSYDSDTAPSFLGFRNLVVIVLGKLRELRILQQTPSNRAKSSATCD